MSSKCKNRVSGISALRAMLYDTGAQRTQIRRIHKWIDASSEVSKIPKVPINITLCHTEHSITPALQAKTLKYAAENTWIMDPSRNHTEKEQQTKPNVTRRKETTKIRAEINGIDTKKTIEKINKTKSWFFENINKTDKPLIRPTKEKERTHNQKWKRWRYKWHHKNTKGHKTRLWTIYMPTIWGT